MPSTRRRTKILQFSRPVCVKTKNLGSVLFGPQLRSDVPTTKFTRDFLLSKVIYIQFYQSFSRLNFDCLPDSFFVSDFYLLQEIFVLLKWENEKFSRC